METKIDHSLDIFKGLLPDLCRICLSYIKQEIVTYHPNGSVRELYTEIDGKKQGKYLAFNTLGKLTYRVDFVDGKQNGNIYKKSWDDSYYNAEIVDDQLEGKIRIYNVNRQLREEVFYVNGVKNRFQIHYMYGRTVGSHYAIGKFHGLQFVLNPDGSLVGYEYNIDLSVFHKKYSGISYRFPMPIKCKPTERRKDFTKLRLRETLTYLKMYSS